MNTTLRTVFAGLSLSLLFATGCGLPEEQDADQVVAAEIEGESAALTASSTKRETIIDIADPNATSLIASLQAAGATLHTVPDASLLTVKSLSCSLGKSSSSCSMIGDGRSIHASTTKANAIAGALKGAKVTSQLQNGLTVYKAKLVDCNIGTFTGRPIASCQLTIQTP